MKPMLSRRPLRGFTLVELMIAMGLGMLLMLALTLIFTNNSRTRAEIEKSSRQIENGRYAMQLLVDDLSNAGFLGEAGYTKTNTVLQSRCPSASTLVTAVQTGRLMPVQGVMSSGDVGGAPSCASDFKSGSGYLVVRRASTCAVGEEGCDAFVGGAPHIQVPACRTEIDEPTVPKPVKAATSLANLKLMTRACDNTKLAPIYRLFNRVYYVANNNQSGDGIPTLKRAELTGSGYTVTPLVDGIERLYFEYGLDTDNDRSPDHFVSASALGSNDTRWPTLTTDNMRWRNVVAVRIYLLARNTETSPGYTDPNTYTLGSYGTVSLSATERQYKRQLYVSTASLGNPARRSN